MKIAKKLFSQYLEQDEELLAVFHKHPFVMIPELATVTFFGYLLPIFLYILFPQFALFFLLWISLSMVRLFYVLSIWYFDAILVTSVSLVDVTWKGFFKRSSSRLEFHQVEGVSYNIMSFIRTVFNYGDVAIKSTSGGTPIMMKDAMNPPRIERNIMEHQENHISAQNMEDAEALKSLLTKLIRNHIKTEKDSTNK